MACVSQKLDRRARAAELYRSDWFRKARTYVEETGSPWFILSAAHGLVRPNDNRRTLLAMGRDQPRAKGPALDPRRLPDNRLDHLIQTHRDIFVVEALRAERERRVRAVASINLRRTGA